MSSYELVGPFNELVKNALEEQVSVHTVKLKAERNSSHPLNPVGHLRRVVSGHTILQEAILLLGVQFFEIFTVVHERQEGLAQRKGNALKSRIKSVATSAGGHLPKRLRRDHRGDEPPDELEAIVAREQDMSEDDILKDHVFSCGVAFAQILKLKSNGADITVYYHPNTMKATKLSKNNLATALRFTICLETEEETTNLLRELEAKMARYSQAAVFLGEQFALPSALHIIAVTRPLAEEGCSDTKLAELLLEKDAPWGTTVTAPDSWGPEATGSEIPLWVFLVTPLGYGKCEISPQVVALYKKGNEASFYVGVRHPQVNGSTITTISNLHKLRPAGNDDPNNNPDDNPESDDSEEQWQPDGSDEPVLDAMAPTTPLQRPSLSPGRNSLHQSSFSASSGSRGHGAQMSKSRAASAHGVAGRHVRLHCYARCMSSGPDWSGGSGSTQAPDPHAAQHAGLSLPGGLHLSDKQLAMCAAVAAIAAWLYFSWALMLTLLNGAALAYVLRTRAAPGALPPATVSSRTCNQGAWKVTLVKAEVVTDEPWSAAGESIVVVADEDDEESAEARKQRVAEQYGFSNDTVERYMQAFRGDEAMAHRRMRATYEWKQENGVVDILSQPQPNFEFFKRMFRHGLLGVTKQGHPVWFMKVGDMKEGFKSYKTSGLTQRDLARHVALCMDYMYQVVETAPLPNGKALWVLDLKGMGLSDIGSEAFELGKAIAIMISTHWPERLYRSFIINMPGFFSILWKLVEPMLAPTTRKKIRLLRKHDMMKEMLEEINEADIPVEYGGKLEGGVYAAKTEKELWAFVAKLNSDGA